MTTNKSSASETKLECCMCGDCGFSSELFQCKLCQFRSQHRYCSNLYPRAEVYRICNWCLNQKEEKSQNSSNSSSSIKGLDDYTSIKKNPILNRPIKKQRSLDSPAPAPAPAPSRRRSLPEERLREIGSGEIPARSGSMKRQVMFRNKVRRYKLLEEVSS